MAFVSSLCSCAINEQGCPGKFGLLGAVPTGKEGARRLETEARAWYLSEEVGV